MKKVFLWSGPKMSLVTVTIAKIISVKNARACVSMVSYLKKLNKNKNIKEKREKKSWEPFRICLLNSTADPADFHSNWAGFNMIYCFNR